MKVKRRRVVLIIVVGATIVAGGGYALAGFPGTSDTPAGRDTPEAGAEDRVSVLAVEEGSVSVRVEGPAIVEPYRSQQFRSEIAGTVVTAVFEGDRPAEGDVLLSFDSSNARDAVAQAELSLRQAKIDERKARLALEQAESELSERSRLFEAGTISRDQLDAARDARTNAELALEASQIRIRQSELILQRSRADLEATTLRAPYDGVVLSTSVGPGDRVSSGTPLLTFADLSRLRLKAEVDEYDIGEVREGLAVTISADALGDESIRSRIERISPAAEIVNNLSIFTVSAVIRNNDDLLRPGMSADLSILISSAKGVLVPSRSLSSVRGRSYLDVYADGEIETRRVVVGADDGVNAAVTEGLEAGEQVVLPDTGSLSFATETQDAGSSIVPINVPGTGGGSR